MTKQKFAFALFLTPALFLIFTSIALADLIPISPTKLKRLPNPTDATTSSPVIVEPTSAVSEDRYEPAPSPIHKPNSIIAPEPSPLPPPGYPNFNTTTNELPQNILLQEPVADPNGVKQIQKPAIPPSPPTVSGWVEPLGEQEPLVKKIQADPTSDASIGTIIALATLILVGAVGLIIVKLPTTKTPPTEQPTPTPPTDNKPTEPKL
ncbi:MAG: hypothetical protein WCK11_00800 [Candidatus Falkowbacteria bacterium]